MGSNVVVENLITCKNWCFFGFESSHGFLSISYFSVEPLHAPHTVHCRLHDLIQKAEEKRGEVSCVLFGCFEFEAAYEHVLSPDLNPVCFWSTQGLEVCDVFLAWNVYAIVS